MARKDWVEPGAVVVPDALSYLVQDRDKDSKWTTVSWHTTCADALEAVRLRRVAGEDTSMRVLSVNPARL